MTAGLRLAFVALLAMGPTIAVAQTACPTSPSDLDTGVRIGFTGSFDLAVVRNPDGSLIEHETYSDGTGFLLRSRDGIVAYESHETTANRIDANTTEGWEYNADPNTLPRIEPGASFAIQRTAVLSDGSRWPETMQVRVDRAEEISLGGCPLTSMRVSVEFQSDGSSYYETYQYLEELEFGIYLGGADRPADIGLAQPVSIAVQDPGMMPGREVAPAAPAAPIGEAPPAPVGNK